MKLTFNNVYQSITSFDQTEISDFAVITGLNGSGKTHLLNAINNGKITVSGIDLSEIIFYNYNDFTIHNADPGHNKQIQEKQNAFQTKSNSFNQRLNSQRSQALNSFQLTLAIGDMTFGEYSFQHQPDLDAMLDWSEADFELYQKRAGAVGDTYSTEFIQSLNPHQTQFFQSVGLVSPLTDVKNLLNKVKAFKIEADAMHMLRSSGYNKNLSSWNPEELTAIFPGFQAAADKYHFLETQHSLEGFPLIDANLMTFLHLLLSISGEGAGITLKRCLSLKSTLPELVSKLELHLEKSLDPQILKILRQMTDGILTPIAIESAFLNLHDIKQAEKQYQIQKKQNEYSGYQKNYLKQPAHHLSDADFLSQYGNSPVDTLNHVLNEYDCNGYEFKQSDIYYQFGQDVYAQNIDVSLFNKAGNYTTTLDALSSGERTLLALAFTIYKLKQRKAVARLFLMDEIDSALHPSMSKRLLHVLYHLFHKEMGINIIISTHSPSTVAFSPPNGTYVMRRDQTPRLISATIDAALSELTAGVPSFSVNYENRRQVFVESPNDVSFYEALNFVFKDKLHPDISLNFISSGDAQTDKNGQPKSNCSQVIKITNLLRKAGNKFIWGIIDWDLENTEEDGVKVLGMGQRYSIENFLLDPLLIGILLWREKLEEPEFFGQTAETKYFEVSQFSTEALQAMINVVLDKLQPHFEVDSNTHQAYQILNGSTLSLPEAFARHQGHQLEELYLKVFPKLQQIKRGDESALKIAVIKKVIADFAELAPKELIDILKNVQVA